MAKKTAAAERYEENLISVPFESKFNPGRALKGTEEVSVKYKISGEPGPFQYFKLPSVTQDPITNEIEAKGDLDLPEDARYTYSFVIHDTATNKDQKVSRDIISTAKEAPPTPPGSIIPINELTGRIRKSAGTILKSIKSPEDVGGVDALVDELELQLDSMGVKGHSAEFAVKLFCDAVVELEGLPTVIKRAFKDPAKQPKTYAEFANLLKKSGDMYRQQVFLKLKSDKKARAFFHLEHKYDKKAPFGKNERYNALFFKICAQHGDFSSAAPYLKQAVQGMEVRKNEPTDPDFASKEKKRQLILTKRLNLLKKIKTNSDSHGKGAFGEFLKEIPKDRKGRILDAAVQAAIIGGGLVTGTVVIPAALFGIKAGLQGLTGVSIGDLLEGKHLGEKLLRNNVLTEAITTKGKSVDVLGHTLKKSALFALPGVSVFGHDTSTASYKVEEADHDGDELDEKKKASEEEQFMTNACLAAAA